MAAKQINLSEEFVQLARVALSGRTQDVHALLQRTARRAQGSEPNLADSLIGLLREAPTRSSPLRRRAETPLPVDADSRLHLMKVEESPSLDYEPVFVRSVSQQLHELLQERSDTGALAKAGLEPTKTTLFVGPPGVGKTMAARWLARELGRPLIILDLAAVMSSYLGRTGSNLRLVLDYAKSSDCILLLDELDAIAKRRDDRGEIGELKRLVTVLIQQIDDWPSSNLLIAATNHDELLDPAIWRRFERVIDFPLPDYASINAFAKNYMADHVVHSDEWSNIISVSLAGKSFSDITRDLVSARRQSILKGIPLEDQLAELIRSDHLSKQGRIDLAVALVESGFVSERKAQELTGVARDTIRARKRSNHNSQGRGASQS